MSNEVYISEITSENKKHTAKLYVVSPEETLIKNQIVIRIKTQPSAKFSLHTLHLPLMDAKENVEKVLYNHLGLDKKFGTYENNISKIYVHMLQCGEQGDASGIEKIKKFDAICDMYDNFSGKSRCEASDAKTLVDYNLKSNSAKYLDENGQNLVTSSPFVFNEEANGTTSGPEIYIQAQSAKDTIECLEKESIKAQTVTEKFLGFVPQIGDFFKPKTVELVSATYKTKFIIDTSG